MRGRLGQVGNPSYVSGQMLHNRGGAAEADLGVPEGAEREVVPAAGEVAEIEEQDRDAYGYPSSHFQPRRAEGDIRQRAHGILQAATELLEVQRGEAAQRTGQPAQQLATGRPALELLALLPHRAGAK